MKDESRHKDLLRAQYERTPGLSPEAREAIGERILAQLPTASGRAERRPWIRRLSPLARWTRAPVATHAFAALAGAAVLAGVIWLGPLMHPGPKAPAGPMSVRRDPESATEGQRVRFCLDASGAQSVSLLGDFNGWNPAAGAMKRSTADGLWAAEFRVPRGRHSYAFLVNGKTWVTDPAAPLAPGEGLGSQTSVLLVGKDDPI